MLRRVLRTMDAARGNGLPRRNADHAGGLDWPPHNLTIAIYSPIRQRRRERSNFSAGEGVRNLRFWTERGA